MPLCQHITYLERGRGSIPQSYKGEAFSRSEFIHLFSPFQFPGINVNVCLIFRVDSGEAEDGYFSWQIEKNHSRDSLHIYMLSICAHALCSKASHEMLSLITP